MTPLLQIKKDTWAENHQTCLQKRQGTNFPTTVHLRGFFSVRRIPRQSRTAATGAEIAPLPVLLSFAFPSLQCVAGLFSSVVLTNPSGNILRAFFLCPEFFGGNKKPSGTWGPVPHFQLDASFLLAGKMQLCFSDWAPAELTCSAKSSRLLCMRKIWTQ